MKLYYIKDVQENRKAYPQLVNRIVTNPPPGVESTVWTSPGPEHIARGINLNVTRRLRS